jgi:alkylation response protein AidB-like acyl-CoA dehydrogenase
MFELSEAQRMIQDMVRQWCDRELRPRIPQLEAGAVLPYDLMRDLARQFGLADMARAALAKRVRRLREREASAAAGGEAAGVGGLGEMLSDADLGGDPMTFAILAKELCRCSPGFASSWGVTLALAGGAILTKGTADQVERFGIPLATLDKIGSWCLTEPCAGSDAFGSMRIPAMSDSDSGGSRTPIPG